MAIQILPRSAWTNRPPRSRTKLQNTRNGWFVHHNGPPMSGPTSQRLRGVQNYHMDKRNWADFAYSFAVDDEGLIWEGRGWGIAGAHTTGYNMISHAIFVPIGTGQEPTDACAGSIRALISEGARLGHSAAPLRPHNAVANKPCPGPTLTRWIAEGRLSPGGTPMLDLPANRAETIRQLQQIQESAGFDLGPTGADGDPGRPNPADSFTLRNQHAMKNELLDLRALVPKLREEIAQLEDQLADPGLPGEVEHPDVRLAEDLRSLIARAMP